MSFPKALLSFILKELRRKSTWIISKSSLFCFPSIPKHTKTKRERRENRKSREKSNIQPIHSLEFKITQRKLPSTETLHIPYIHVHTSIPNNFHDSPRNQDDVRLEVELSWFFLMLNSMFLSRVCVCVCLGGWESRAEIPGSSFIPSLPCRGWLMVDRWQRFHMFLRLLGLASQRSVFDS